MEEVQSLFRCHLLSVQVGDCASAIHESVLSSLLIPHQALFHQGSRDWLKTASVLLKVDILITNDTSLAHLGGLLGVPTWVLLKCHPFWQWGDHGQSSVWCQSVRCFRQTRPFEWTGAMRRLDDHLGGWIDQWHGLRNL